MSGISSKRGSIAFGVQTAKGTAATVPTVKCFLSGDPTIAPTKTRSRYTMTDASQDNGPAYTSLMAVEGGVQVYAHPEAMGFLSAVVSGANADAGVAPNFTHTATPADDMMWVTVWREVGGVIVERYLDCKIHSLQMEGSAGQPLTISLDIIGSKSTFLAADTSLAALTSHGLLYPEGAGLIKIGGAAAKLHKISFGISRNASGYQADGYGYDDIDPGAREVTLSFATRFASGAIGVNEYREFYYGSAAGTEQAAAVATRAVEFEFLRNANLSWKVALPQVTYAAVPVNAGTSGDPIEVEVACEVEKPAAASIYTITTKDQKASYNS